MKWTTLGWLVSLTLISCAGEQISAAEQRLEAPVPGCVADRSQAALIGDSYITGFLSPPLQPELDKLLSAAGLVTGYPNCAVAGAAMAAGGISEPDLIPHQFERALAASSDIRFVIMNGNGNDWLLPAFGKPDCKNMPDAVSNAGCQAIVAAAIATWVELMQRMAASGVRDVIFFGLPHFRPDGLGGLVGNYPNELIDYAHPLEQAACEQALTRTGTLACHYIDLRRFEDIANFSHVVDGSHPSLSAQQNLAREIFRIMQDHCLGQSAGSGCCQIN